MAMIEGRNGTEPVVTPKVNAHPPSPFRARNGRYPGNVVPSLTAAGFCEEYDFCAIWAEIA
jgi:hypothetical protein